MSIGMGHIGRCLNIAKAVRKQGADVLWIVSRDSDTAVMSENGLRFIRSDSGAEVVWNEKLRDCILSDGVTGVLIDSYFIKQHELDSVNCPVPVFYIDDLNMFDYNVSGIFNYNFEADKKMYEKTRFLRRRSFLGPKYFPLNSELWSVPRCRINENVGNVLITTGSTDPDYITDKILRGIGPSRYGDIMFSVLIGKFFGEKYKSFLVDKYSKSGNVKFVGWGQKISEIYGGADMLIAPGATMIFEALSLGIPCLSFMFVDNQEAQCDVMDKMKIVPFIGDLRGDKSIYFADKFEMMLDYRTRKEIHGRSVDLIDGQGAQRIAGILLGKEYENSL